MTERYRRSTGVGASYMQTTKMENEFTPKKTMIILVIVVACFAVLWPKIFYPMLVGSANQQIKPSAIDKTTGCCYVLSDTDVDTIKIVSELCGDIIRKEVGDSAPLTPRQAVNLCQDAVYRACGIDVTVVLQEQVRLGHTTKQILDEIRSLNGSLCLKYAFGVQPWRLGVPHHVAMRNATDYLRQERSPLVRSEMVHPAFRERGRAIPQAKPSRQNAKIIEGMPGPLPGMRPTMGGPGHMVPPPKQQGSGSMGIIMPLYTIGIVIFFTYTLMKIICKKHPETDTIYSKMDMDSRLRRDTLSENGSRDVGSCKLVVNAMSALLDQVDQEMEARSRSSEMTQDECPNSAGLSNGSVKKEEKPSVKIMAMETTESCEDGKRWQSANSSVLPIAPEPLNERVDPPKEIFLERTLPPLSQILVADSATETEKNNSEDDSAVVLAGKMTLSVISLENEELEIGDILKVNGQENKEAIEENKLILREDINHIIEEAIVNIGVKKTDETENVSKDVEPPETLTHKALVDEEDNEEKKRDKDGMNSIGEFEASLEGTLPISMEHNNSNILESQNVLPESFSLKDSVQKGTAGSPMLNLNAKSSSEDSGSTVLSGSGQGSVINVSLRDAEDKNEEEGEEVSEEESDVEYEEEEIEVTDEEGSEGEIDYVQPVETDRNEANRLVNGATQNGTDEDEDSGEEEEVIEEIIEEYSEDEENLELNSN